MQKKADVSDWAERLVCVVPLNPPVVLKKLEHIKSPAQSPTPGGDSARAGGHALSAFKAHAMYPMYSCSWPVGETPQYSVREMPTQAPTWVTNVSRGALPAGRDLHCFCLGGLAWAWVICYRVVGLQVPWGLPAAPVPTRHLLGGW